MINMVVIQQQQQQQQQQLPPALAWEIVFNEQEELQTRPHDSKNHGLRNAASARDRVHRKDLSHLQPLYYPDLASIILSFTGWRDAVKLTGVNKSLQALFDDPITWRVVCESLADEYGLYVPTNYIHGFRRLFFEELWPARHIWREDVSQCDDFQIRVAVRVRPRINNDDGNDGASGAVFLLPLHQRMRLVRQGQLAPEELFTTGDEQAAIQRLLATSSGLSPEILEAVMEAEYLRTLQETAEDSERKIQPPNTAWHTYVPGQGVVGERDRQTLARIAAQSSNVHIPNGAVAARSSGPRVGVHNNNNEHDDDDDDEYVMVGGDHQTQPPSSPPPPPPPKQNAVRLLAAQDSRVVMYVPGQGVQPFLFSNVFNHHSQQYDVYHRAARDSVISFLNGFSACLLCYGQTGSGKTHTIFGPEGVLAAEQVSKDELVGQSAYGVVVRACAEVFGAVNERASNPHTPIRSYVTAEYVEIYNDQLTDLQTGGRVTLRNRGDRFGADQFVLGNCTETELKSVGDCMSVLRRGEEWKRYASTRMNDRSSRAHTIFILTLEQTNMKTNTTVKSRLHLVDLAGCEQVKQSGAVGERFHEAVGINYSLLVLGKVISSLVEDAPHVPFRESILTMMLKPALGGNSRTTVIVCCSPEDEHMEQTLNAVRFGERCTMVTNKNEIEAMSTTQALNIIDETLNSCAAHMRAMEAAGNQHRPAYEKLHMRHQKLLRRKEEILRMM